MESASIWVWGPHSPRSIGGEQSLLWRPPGLCSLGLVHSALLGSLGCDMAVVDMEVGAQSDHFIPLEATVERTD